MIFLKSTIKSDFICALDNELSIDRHFFNLFGLNSAYYGLIPKPARWLPYLKKYPSLSKAIYTLLLFLWFFIGPLYFLFQFILISKHKKFSNSSDFYQSSVILFFSHRCIDLINEKYIADAPRTFLAFASDVKKNSFPLYSRIIKIESLLNIRAKLKVLLLCIGFHFSIFLDERYAKHALNSFMLWRWLLAERSLAYLSGPFFSVSHFDRWAVLIDKSIHRSFDSGIMKSHTLVQHGSVNADADLSGLGFRLPYKLRFVSRLFVFSHSDYLIFERDILSDQRRNNPLSVEIFTPSLFLTKPGILNKRATVLFVGHPLCSDFHINLYNKLKSDSTIYFFYKPHPTSRPLKNLRFVGWEFISDRNYFPVVDVLVSYNSTLVSDYAKENIPAFVHSLPPSHDEFEVIVSQIRHYSK